MVPPRMRPKTDVMRFKDCKDPLRSRSTFRRGSAEKSADGALFVNEMAETKRGVLWSFRHSENW